MITNNQAIGYALLAARVLKLTDKQKKLLESEMNYQMDMKTPEEALEEYLKN